MMGDKEKTLEDYTRAIEMDPQRPGPHWNRASLYEQLGRIEEAIIDYENTLKADPTYSRARSKLDELKNKKNN
jgi:tetratricopeptide (TPR) repeat protein